VRSGSKVFAIVLIVVGAILLGQKQGLVPDLGPLFHAWWPLLLILAGIVMLVRKRG
jgi:lipopolysaccharide export LptBFGC system permease protein LptF